MSVDDKVKRLFMSFKLTHVSIRNRVQYLFSVVFFNHILLFSVDVSCDLHLDYYTSCLPGMMLQQASAVLFHAINVMLVHNDTSNVSRSSSFD